MNYENYLSDCCKNIPRSFIREILSVAEQEDFISFAGGLPNPDFFPVEELKNGLASIFTDTGKETLQYAGSQGFLPLREWISSYYNTKYGMHTKASQYIITNGSQQALAIVSKAMINPGDVVALEKPSYLGGIQALSLNSPVFKQVSLNPDGVDLEELENVILNYGVKLFYAIPNFQNPSGISYSYTKKQELAALLEHYQTILVEDNPYGELHFKGENSAPIVGMLPNQTIWCGSFSKMISPGIRTGWICAPDEMVPWLIKIKQAVDLHTNNIVQRLIYHFLSNHDIESHLQKIRNAYGKQCRVMQNEVIKYFPEGSEITNPEGGMFIWVKLPEGYDTEKLIKIAIQKKVVFVPGRSFFTNGEGNRYMRLNFSNASEGMIIEGIARLSEAIKECEMVFA